MKLLSVNCCEINEDKENYHKYKALIERYAFFEHASFNKDNNHQIFQNYPLLLKIRDAYEPKAFGK
jgi:lantibiotic modifying enzyme